MNNYEYLKKRLGEIISNNNCEFVLYPFGEMGVLTKGILNGLYGVQEKMIIDNILCYRYENIKNWDNISPEDIVGCKILITNINIDCYVEVRERLYGHVEKEQCIELFPVPLVIEEYYRTLFVINKKMKEEGIYKEVPIYHPRKTKSNFFLPLLSKDCIQKTIFLTDDYYERKTLEKVFAYQNGIVGEKVKCGAVLDIGANIGNHTLYFANECGAEKVYCFEPVASTYAILEENIRLNHLENRTQLYSVGLGEEEGKAFSEGCVFNIGGTCLHESEEGDIVVKRLDDLNINEKIVFIKIDVEGMEYGVLKGAMNLIKKNQPYIMIESFGNNIVKVRELFSKIQYTYEALDSSGNWLFCPPNRII